MSSLTSPEEKSRPLAEASTSRPRSTRSQKINQLLEKVYDLEVFEKQIIKINTELIDNNAKVYEISRDVLEEHNKTLARNKMLMKENINLHKQFRLLMKDPQTSSQKKLAKLATSLDEET
jgi:D-Tyr-tRNAtyr deacylase